MRRGLLVAILCAIPSSVPAQTVLPAQPELRVDGFTGRPSAVHVGAGISAPLGTYVRYGAVAGVGAGADGFSARTDLMARFTLDPFREKRWAGYGVAGVSARFDGSSRSYLLLMAGVEGPARRGFAPAIEAGFGGGVRAGIALRRAVPRRR